MQQLKRLAPKSVRRRIGQWRAFRAWYAHPRRRRSKARLEALRDKHRGQRCFVIGNGPSLKQMDLRPLADEVTFGLNRIYLLFEQMGFATTYHVAVNHLLLQQCMDDILSVPATGFVSWRGLDLVPPDSDVILLRPLDRPQFSTNPAWGVFEGSTVTYVAMQLAYYMGFHKVILIGVDHNFETKGPPHKVVVSEGPDKNHFDDTYFGKGFRWQLPDLEGSERAYRMARRAYERAGREIVDATVGGKLEVFPRASFAEILAGKTSL